MWQSAELESVLGGPLDATGLTEQVLHDLCEHEAVESEQLEFKDPRAYDSQPKDRAITWRAEQEFAKDVTAFANHRGGVILIGIAEHERGVAGEIRVGNRPSAEVEHRRLGQALLQYATPAVRVDYVEIPVGEGYATAVVVPSSDHAPHGINVAPRNEQRPLCFAVRDGAHTQFLGEAELADRYQRRFHGAADRRAREQRVLAEGTAALNSSVLDWCYLMVVPAAAADATINRQVVATFSDWLAHLDASSPLRADAAPTGRPIPGPGRLTVTDHPRRDDEDHATPHDTYLELHADGAFFGALELRSENGVGLHPLHVADAVILLADVGLRWARERIGGWGTATVMCGLHAAGRAQQAYELWQTSYGQLGRVPRTRRVVASPGSLVSTSAADLSITESVQDRLVVAYEAGSGLVQHFGLAELLQLAPNGAVNTDTWGNAWQQAKYWAEQRGVERGNSTAQRSPYAPASGAGAVTSGA